MTDNRWKTLVAVAAVVTLYVLTQKDVPLPPIVALILGALNVGLAVFDPNRSHVE